MSTTGAHIRRRHVTSSGMGAGGAFSRDTHQIGGFDPTVEGLPWAEARDGEQANTPDIAPGAVQGSTHILAGSISKELFADSIQPPIVVGALPALPSSTYPVGSFVFLTTDQKLYRNTNGTTWSKTVDGADLIANSVIAGKIAAGAVGANEIAAHSLSARHIQVTADRSNLLLNGGFEEFLGTQGVYVNPGNGLASAELPGWAHGNGVLASASQSVNASGMLVMVIKADTGALANTGMYQTIPVVAGRRYRLRGRAWKGAGTGLSVQILAHAYDKDLVVVAFNALVAVSAAASSTPTTGEAYYTVPSNVAYLGVWCRWAAGPPGGTEVFAFDDVMLELLPEGAQNSPGEVVIDNTGISITNGKITVRNAGSTVIIDGTSNMFKIAASGTASLTCPATSGATVATTVGGTGITTTPAVLAYVGDSTSTTGVRHQMPHFSVVFQNFVAATSGGAVTARRVVHQLMATFDVQVVGSDVVVNWTIENATGASVTRYFRYYILKEAAV